MAILRWQPYSDVDAVRQQIDRLFDDSIFNEFLGDRATAFVPSAELEETDDAIYVRVELPGVNKQDIQVDVSAESVAIRGDRKVVSTTDEGGKRRSEFRYGSFQRTIGLPTRVQHTEAKAAYDNGILTLTLPKTEAEKTKVVTLSFDDPAGPEA